MEEYSKEKYTDANFQPLESEIIDNESSFVNFEILTYPADYTLEVLVNKMENEQIKIPNFQRRFVWSLNQASKLIESFLLGLPVPAIFLYADKDDNLNVIDGQQRLLTIYYFFKGLFGEEKNGKRITFKLVGLKEDSPYSNVTIESLKQSNPSAFNKLNDSVLRAFIVKQIHPKDNTSIYHIFERLNTGGTQLQGQEIRNCIYYGKLNDLIVELNTYNFWRKIFGSTLLNKHKRDEELILRFFSLYYDSKKYSKPMKDFLSNFMANNRNPSDARLNEFKKIFIDTSDLVYEILGEKPFVLMRGLNVAIYDSVFTVIAQEINVLNKNNYKKLLDDEIFIKSVTSGTTDEIAVKNRLERCRLILLGK
jgi:uncharacterized protein with ParB-like and HNH nuclease domain